MPALSKLGFTLIELLVAISIIVIVGTLALIDFGPFRSSQNLQTAVLDLQNFIREAQVNASSGVVCPDAEETVKPWKIGFITDRVEMTCGSLSTAYRTLKFKQEDIKLTGLEVGSGSTQCGLDSLQLVFAPVNASVSFFKVPEKSCDAFGSTSSPTTVKILVQLKNDPPKKLMINLGGVINVE